MPTILKVRCPVPPADAFVAGMTSPWSDRVFVGGRINIRNMI
jgi:hypothetical protein